MKDLYLYYFLLRYPGRSIVFVGSIDGIRRLTPLFEMLQMPVWPLHSQLQQKQRLKNLDRCVIFPVFLEFASYRPLPLLLFMRGISCIWQGPSVSL